MMLLVQDSPLGASDVIIVSLVVGLLYAIANIYILPYTTKAYRFTKQQPWVGLQDESFARQKAAKRSVFTSNAMIVEGYEKYNKKALPFVLPQLNNDPLVVIPPQFIPELTALPDTDLDSHKPLRETISADQTFLLAHDDEIHIDVVRRQLTRKLPLLTEAVHEELKLGIKDQWPTHPGEWSTYKAYPTIMRIVSRAANRVFGGKELCRSQQFIDASREYTVSIFRAGPDIRLWPALLRDWVAPSIQRRYKVYQHYDDAKAIALPIIKQRIKEVLSADSKAEENVDALQWLVEECVSRAKKDPSILADEPMVARLLSLNMVAIHTTSMVSTNTILSICKSPRREEYLQGMREEVERVLGENNGQFTKQAINSMYRIDSAIREAMRHESLGEQSLRRRVVTKNGITLSNGVHLPYGTNIVTASYASHRDPAYHGDNAHEYDAFRFSRPREEYLARVEAQRGNPTHLKSVLEQKNQALVSTGEDFMAFGHGRHSCPGRFFASQEIKLLLAHIVSHYEIKLGPNVGKTIEYNGARTPSDATEIMLRPL